MEKIEEGLVDMPLMWIIWTRRGEPTLSTIAWTTLRVAHMTTRPAATIFFIFKKTRQEVGQSMG